MRGIADLRFPETSRARSIPIRVGNTVNFSGGWSANQAHPSVWENCPFLTSSDNGSSLVGIRNNYKNEAHVLWLIPYHPAGNRIIPGSNICSTVDHPVYAGNRVIGKLQGSQSPDHPRIRGEQFNLFFLVFYGRIIHAYAGNSN